MSTSTIPHEAQVEHHLASIKKAVWIVAIATLIYAGLLIFAVLLAVADASSNGGFSS